MTFDDVYADVYDNVLNYASEDDKKVAVSLKYKITDSVFSRTSRAGSFWSMENSRGTFTGRQRMEFGNLLGLDSNLFLLHTFR